MPLRDLWAEPEFVPLGSSAYAITPFTLRDLAALERWACAVLGTPRALLAEALADPDPESRRWILYRAYDRAKDDGPHIEDREAAALFDTAEGVCVQLWLAIRRHRDEFTHEDAISIANEVTAEQWRRFLEIAWHIHPLDQVAAAIDEEISVTFPIRQFPPKPGQWCEAIAKVIEHTGWTLDRIGDLTLAQWQTLFGGESRHPIASPIRPPGWTKEDFQERVQAPRKAFWAPYWTARKSRNGKQAKPADLDNAVT